MRVEYTSRVKTLCQTVLFAFLTFVTKFRMDLIGFQLEDSTCGDRKVCWQGPEAADHIVSEVRAEEVVAGSDLTFSSNSVQETSMEGKGSSYLI